MLILKNGIVLEAGAAAGRLPGKLADDGFADTFCCIE
jgi:uncharacterized membrane protein